MPSGKHTFSLTGLRRHPALLVLLGIEILLIFLFFRSALRPMPSYAFTPDQLEDWTVDLSLSFDSQGRMGVEGSGEAVDEILFSTAELNLPAGYYHLIVRYSAQAGLDENNALVLPSVASYTEQSGTLCAYEGHLDPCREEQTLDLYVLRSCTDARVLLKSNGAAFYLESLSIMPNRAMMLLLAAGASLLLLAADLVLALVWRGSPCALVPAARWALLGVLGIVFLACIPLMQNNGGMRGDDLVFHMLRIDNIANSLAEGEFPVRIYHEAKGHYGYAPSLYYGEILLYLPALLRLLGCELRLTYQLYIAGITLATAAVAYGCLHEIFGRRNLALLGCALYVLSPYRLVCVYTRAAVGEYTAFLFLPLIALGLWRLYARRGPVPAWGVLAVGFGGLLQTHTITLILSTLTVFCLAICLWRRTFHPFVLLQWGKAAGACILVNLWFLFPFVSMAGSRLSGQGGDIGGQGMTLAQLFTKGSTAIFGLALPLGGALLLAAFLTAPPAPGTSYKPGLCALAVGAFTLFASTRLFPWSAMPGLPVLGKLLGSIQFPWRFLGLATISLTLAALFALQQFQRGGHPLWARGAGAGLLALTFFFCLTFLPDQVSTDTASFHGDPSQWMIRPPSKVTITMDDLYLPDGAAESGLGYTAAEPADIRVEDITRDGRTTYVECSTDGAEGFLDLPLLYYPGYTTDTGTLYRSQSGLVGLAVPAGFEGTVTVTWQEPKRWLAADLVSLVSIAALAGRAFYRRRKKA